jgi:hypothetical protein
MSFVSSNEALGEVPCGATQQRLVDSHFHSHLAQWRDVYQQTGVEGAIYRKRLEIVLDWIDNLAIPAGEKVLDRQLGNSSRRKGS